MSNYHIKHLEEYYHDNILRDVLYDSYSLCFLIFYLVIDQCFFITIQYFYQ